MQLRADCERQGVSHMSFAERVRKLGKRIQVLSGHPVYLIATAAGLVVTLAGVVPLISGKPYSAYWLIGAEARCRSFANDPAKIPGTEEESPGVDPHNSADAVLYCGKAATGDKPDPALRFDLARAYEANGQAAVAINEYLAAAKAGYVPAMALAGRRLNSLGDESGAIEWLQCAAVKGSRQAEYDLSLILLARSRGDDLPRARWLASHSSQAGFQPASKLMATVASFPGSAGKVADDWLAQACPAQDLARQAASPVKSTRPQ